jgi:hypothetical protein
MECVMIEVFRYWLNGLMNDDTIVSPRLATRGFIDAANGRVVEGSLRKVDEALVGTDDQAIQGFTGQQIDYLRELISLGSLNTRTVVAGRSWLVRLIENGLVSATESANGRFEYAITALGRAAVRQLL